MRERVDIENPAIKNARFSRDLTGGLVTDGAFRKNCGNVVIADGVDHLSHLLRRALTFGIDRPEIDRVETKVASQVGECTLRTRKPAAIGRHAVDHGLEEGAGGPA